MDFRMYQEEAAKTASKTGDPFLMGALGLAGEAGEVIDIIKKMIFHQHHLDTDKLTKELGDVLWYLAHIASAARIDLNDVATVNIAKLKARYGDAFSVEKSLNRAEGDD